MKRTVVMLLLLAAFGCSSSGNPLEFEGIKFENGELVYCFREVDPIPFLIGDVRILNELKMGEDPQRIRYVRVPEDQQWDLQVMGASVMTGANPSGSGTSDYVPLGEGGQTDFQLRAALKYQFQLQGLRMAREQVRFDVYDGVPVDFDETVSRFLGALFFGIRIEEKPPLTGLQNLDTLLGEIDSSLPTIRPSFTWNDQTGVPICHSNGVLQEIPDAESEIVQFGVFGGFLDQPAIDNLNNKFPAGQGTHGFTSLPSSSLSLSVGYYAFAFQVRAAELDLTDPQKILQIGFVFDTDDDPADNFMASQSFPKDLFDETDWWGQGTYDSSNGFQLRTTDARNGSFMDVPSTARMINYKEVSLFIVAGTEIDRMWTLQSAQPLLPPYRVTFFKHFGDFGLNPPNVFKVDTAPTVDLPLARVIIPN